MKQQAIILSLLLAAIAAARGEGVWIDVPYTRQVENGCGAAAVSMTLQYWAKQGIAVGEGVADADEIYRALYSVEAHGIPASSMRQYLEDHRFRALAFEGRWADLGEQLAKGRPLIVAMRSGRESHYVVVAGVSGEAVEMNDPADRKLRRMGRAEFEKKWKAAGNWTLLAVPRSGS